MKKWWQDSVLIILVLVAIPFIILGIIIAKFV